MSNPYEIAGREKKASTLLDAIDRLGYLPLVDHFGPEHWAVVAKKAGVNPPSPETINVVLERLERRKKGQGA